MNNTFSGRYYKCQSDTHTIAVIEADHGGTRSVQIITDEQTWSFSEDISRCSFSDRGIHLEINENGSTVSGDISFSDLTPLPYDIMGPFARIPFMQCYHMVGSMRHRTDGRIVINGISYDFTNAIGYIEGDRGRSFPREYLWTHSFFENGSLMLSIAHIPFGVFCFTGIICAIVWQGKEYRFATYLGAKVISIADNEAAIRQGDYTLHVRLIEKKGLPLAAPVSGQMIRTIHESASCRASYCLKKGAEPLFCFETDKASFEYEFTSARHPERMITD